MSAIWANLLGGIGLFLLGMQMMTAGLTRAAGPSLKSTLESATRSRGRAFAIGTAMTALLQSSSAVTVASIGFANAGLVGFANLVWVIYGTNLGNTMTGWIVALMGARFSIGALALPLLGLGMIGRMLARGRISGAGEALAGFGAFFLGIATLQAGFADLTPRMMALTDLLRGVPGEYAAYLAIGIAMTLLTQSSSATIAIVLSAASGGSLGFEQSAVLIVGASIGTTSTAVFASIGATSAARRVAFTHLGFNIAASAIALLFLPWLLQASIAVLGADNPMPALALFHTLYTLLGVAAVAPVTPAFIRLMSSRFGDEDRRRDRPLYVDDTLSEVPQLALRALALEFRRLVDEAFALARARLADQAPPEQPDQAGQDGQVGQVGQPEQEVARLGARLRRQLEAVSRQPLPAQSVDSLADGIRALLYLDELAVLIAALPAPPDEQVLARVSTAFAMLELTASESCTRAPDAAVLARLEAGLAEGANAYQAIKDRLLACAVRGEVPLAQVEHALAHARLLRDVANLGLKTQLALWPWWQAEAL